MRRRLADESGFSLVELAIVGGLLLLIGTAALTVLESGVRTHRGQQVRAETLEDQRTAMERMTKEIRQAVEVDTTSTRSSLGMETLIGGVEHDVVYDVVDGTLRRTQDAGSAVPLVRGVASVEVFCYDPPDCLLSAPASTTPPLVQVTLSVEPDTRGAPAVLLQTDVHLRNG